MKVQENEKRSNAMLVLTGMIVNDEVCSRIAVKWEKRGLFFSPWENLVGGWCVRYNNKHHKAPGEHIEHLFNEWTSNGKCDRVTVKAVEKFLGHLSGEYSRRKKGINPAFTLDVAGNLFNEIKATRFTEDMLSKINAGEAPEFWGEIQRIRQIDLGRGSRIRVLQDRSKMWDAIQHKGSEILVKYPGPLGEFFGDNLARDSFVAFLAPPKRGKTWWLLDLAWRAMLNRNKVAFFQIGDLSEHQIVRRFAIRALARPLKEGKTWQLPISIKRNKSVITVEREDHKTQNGLSRNEIDRRLDKIIADKIRDDCSYLDLSVHPNSSINIDGIRNVLKEWNKEDGYLPDVIVIDYADILAIPTGFRGESRDGVNENWKGMRRLSQELHCLVVTATQGNALSFETETLSLKNFSEDRRKFDHVTAMYGINQTAKEKLKGLARLNPLVVREDEFHIGKPVYVTPCLSIANPAVRSLF